MIEKRRKVASKCRKPKGKKGVKVWNTKNKSLKWCRRTAGAKRPVCGFKSRKAACKGKGRR